MKQLLKELEEDIKWYEKDYVWYCVDRWELNCKTKKKAKELLNDCSADWDWENLAWEQGHLAWLREAYNKINIYLKKKD